MFVFSVSSWFSSCATIFQPLPFVLSHGSRNQSTIEFRKASAGYTMLKLAVKPPHVSTRKSVGKINEIEPMSVIGGTYQRVNAIMFIELKSIG
jgi:hypothetical protein